MTNWVCYICGSKRVSVSAKIDVNTGHIFNRDWSSLFCKDCNAPTEIVDIEKFNIDINKKRIK